MLLAHLLTFDEPDPAAVGIARHRSIARDPGSFESVFAVGLAG
jgi:hypothetical protein